MKTRLQESRLWRGRCKRYKTQRRENSLPGKHQRSNTSLLLCERTTREPPLELYLTLKHTKPTHPPKHIELPTHSKPPPEAPPSERPQNVPKCHACYQATVAANAVARSKCPRCTTDKPLTSRPFPLDSIVRKKFYRDLSSPQSCCRVWKKNPNTQYHSHKKGIELVLI